MVDGDGNRFMDEAGHYALQNVTLSNHAKPPYWSLYNGLQYQALDIAESGLDTGTVVKGDTLEEVAKAAGVDPANLQAAVDEYNKAVVTGVDDEFEKPVEYLTKPIAEGPYYMIQIVVSGSDTLGGVKTNFKREVIDADGNPLPGLYAVGSMQNKWYYNRMYFSGSSLTFGVTDGRIAGAAAAGVADPVAYPVK